MNAANDMSELVDDLAARWTDSALEVLNALGIRGSSVEMELESWHTLQDVLRMQPLAGSKTCVLNPRTLHVHEADSFLALLRVTRKFTPGVAAAELAIGSVPRSGGRGWSPQNTEPMRICFRGPCRPVRRRRRWAVRITLCKCLRSAVNQSRLLAYNDFELYARDGCQGDWNA